MRRRLDSTRASRPVPWRLAAVSASAAISAPASTCRGRRGRPRRTSFSSSVRTLPPSPSRSAIPPLGSKNSRGRRLSCARTASAAPSISPPITAASTASCTRRRRAYSWKGSRSSGPRRAMPPIGGWSSRVATISGSRVTGPLEATSLPTMFTPPLMT